MKLSLSNFLHLLTSHIMKSNINNTKSASVGNRTCEAQGFNPKETACFSETSASTKQSTRRGVTPYNIIRILGTACF